MPELAWLDDSQTLTYLHATISTHRQRVSVPEVPFHLDALLADSPLTTGLAPRLGEQHLRTLSVRGFPTSTWPGMLDDLNRLGFAYRWSTRFICLEKDEAEKELVRLRRQWFAKRKGVLALLREAIFQQESPLLDSDADAALQELGADQIAFGYVTATVTVSDADAQVADEKLRRVERVVQGHGFVTIAESLNAVEAWLSSIPGNAYANVRQPLISTLNLAHLMPVSAVWAGPARNEHLNGPPLVITRTDGATPFRLVTHVGDVGHTLVAGPTAWVNRCCWRPWLCSFAVTRARAFFCSIWDVRCAQRCWAWVASTTTLEATAIWPSSLWRASISRDTEPGPPSGWRLACCRKVWPSAPSRRQRCGRRSTAWPARRRRSAH